MSWAATAVIGGSIISGKRQSDSARSAAKSQSRSEAAAIAEQRRQFDKLQQLFAPYVQAGERGLTGLESLTGTQGVDAQQAAIAGLEQSPEMMAMIQQGENAMLQNAAATGGLRGGNLQAAMAQFRPQILSDMINQQYGRLGNLAQLGQSSAAGQGTAGMNMASNIGTSLRNQGQAAAQASLAQGKIWGDTVGSLAGGLAGGLNSSGSFGSGFAKGYGG